MFWAGHTRPIQLVSTTGTPATQKERLPQEPPPPAEPPPAASSYNVTVRGPNRDVANYKIKEHAKIGEIYTDHATHWLTDTGSLRFLLDGEGIDVNQTPSTLSLAGFTDSQTLHVDCFLPQGGPHLAHRQRLPGPLPSFTKQPQRPPSLPGPPLRRARSSSDCHSCGSDSGSDNSGGSGGSDGHDSKRSSG